MTHDEALNILKQHQAWRMGKTPYDAPGETQPHHPKELTSALDYAIAYMSNP